MKRRIYKRYRTKKKGGQHYYTGRKNYHSTPLIKAPIITVYHGTSRRLADRILQEGLLPSQKTGEESYAMTKHRDKVYTTLSPYTAYRYASDNSRPVVLRVDLTKDQFNEGKDLDKWYPKDVLIKEAPPTKIKVVTNPHIKAMRFWERGEKDSDHRKKNINLPPDFFEQNYLK